MKSKILAMMLFAGMAIAACSSTKEGTSGADSTSVDTTMTDTSSTAPTTMPPDTNQVQ